MARNKKAIPQEIRRKAIIRDKGTCRYCGNKGRYIIFSEKGWVWQEHELDHVYPEALGGQAVLDNIVVACRKCNRHKGHKTLEEVEMKLISI